MQMNSKGRLTRIPHESAASYAEPILRAIRSERNSLVLPRTLRGEVNFSRDAHLESDPAARSDAPASPLRLVTPDSPGPLPGGGGGHFREPWSVKLFLLALSYWLAGWIALATVAVIVARMVGA